MLRSPAQESQTFALFFIDCGLYRRFLRLLRRRRALNRTAKTGEAATFFHECQTVKWRKSSRNPKRLQQQKDRFQCRGRISNARLSTACRHATDVKGGAAGPGQYGSPFPVHSDRVRATLRLSRRLPPGARPVDADRRAVTGAGKADSSTRAPCRSLALVPSRRRVHEFAHVCREPRVDGCPTRLYGRANVCSWRKDRAAPS